MPIILATKEADIRRIAFQSQPGQIICKTLSLKTLHKNRAVQWLKVKTLSSVPVPQKKKKKRKKAKGLRAWLKQKE
jgi:hypothetical protein